MITRVLSALLMVVACTVSGCFDNSDKGDSELTELIKADMGWLYKANPSVDAEKAIKDGDFRYIGIYGYTLSVPGVDGSCLRDKSGEMSMDSSNVKPIGGTSDVVVNYEHAKLIAIAREYAYFYNVRIRLHRLGDHESECSS